jgi:dipeptidyl aminopeptidase/acylaminoacyl peptidase
VSFEQHLRDAMRARVERVKAPDLMARSVRSRRIQLSAVRACAAILVAVAAVAVLVMFVQDERGSERPSGSSGGYPSWIVAVKYDGRLVVLDARTGKVVRTLARNAVAENGVGGVSVSSDGQRVYFTRQTTAKCDDNVGGRTDALSEIASVPVRGGAVRSEVSASRWPAVSPDGRYLAFAGVPICSGAGRTIVLKSLVAGVPDRRFQTVDVPDGTPGTVAELAWAPDSRHLVFRRDIGSTYPYVLDIDTARAVDDGRRVLIGDGSGISGFFGRSDELLGAVVPAGTHPDEFEFWVVDATTGARTRLLFSLVGRCCGQSYVADSPGRNVLVTGAHLYRWSLGDARPTPLAARIAVAAWVPDTARGRLVPQPRQPARLVAVASGGRLIVASARDGHMIRLLASDYGGGGLAVDPEGRTVYYTRRSDRACNNPVGDHSLDIVAVPVRGGKSTLIQTDALDPKVSPDGQRLAFTGVPNCSLLAGAVGVRSLADLSADPLVWTTSSAVPPDASPELSPFFLVWLPDSRNLLFASGEDGTARVLDTRTAQSLDGAPSLRLPSTSSVCCSLDGGSLIGANTVDDRSSLWTFDATSGSPRRRLTCCGQPVDVDRSGVHVLVYYTDPEHPGGLYRYTIGDRRLALVAPFLADAVWLPGS